MKRNILAFAVKNYKSIINNLVVKVPKSALIIKFKILHIINLNKFSNTAVLFLLLVQK